MTPEQLQQILSKLDDVLITMGILSIIVISAILIIGDMIIKEIKKK